jgi:hypothetical protein
MNMRVRKFMSQTRACCSRVTMASGRRRSASLPVDRGQSSRRPTQCSDHRAIRVSFSRRISWWVATPSSGDQLVILVHLF